MGLGPVKACDHCQTVVRWGSGKITVIGQAAALVDTDSPLSVGLFGRYNDRGFRVTGRIQKSNGGSVWDEWCLKFDDGTWAWLAESEGFWHIMLDATSSAPKDLALSSLKPLGIVSIASQRFVIEEVGNASTVACEGEIPDFDKSHRFVEATAPKGVFASLEEGVDGVTAWVGHRTNLRELGFDLSALSPGLKRQALSQARCTQCNGPLDLKAPDATKSVVCPFCGALHKVDGAALAFLSLLDKPARAPVIPLGAKGAFRGATWTAIAYLERSCRVSGDTYGWNEWLLFNRDRGFVWLMQANGHWTWLEPLAAGDVVLGESAKYNGQSFRKYQSVSATTDCVIGECYWEVQAGDMAFATEFIAPPHSVNIDATQDEVSLTYGELIPGGVVQKAFGLKEALPRPSGIAPAQVNPNAGRVGSSWGWALGYCAGIIVVLLAMSVMTPSQALVQVSAATVPSAPPTAPEQQAFSESFDIKKDTPLEVQLHVPDLSNSWFAAEVDFVNEETGDVIATVVEAEYYEGTDSDGRWTEGSRMADAHTQVVPKGRYVMRVAPSFDAQHAYVVTAKTDSPSWVTPFFFMLMLLVVPVLRSMRSASFETQRWNDSVFQQNPWGASS